MEEILKGIFFLGREVIQNPEIDSKNCINNLYFFKGFLKGKSLFYLYL